MPANHMRGRRTVVILCRRPNSVDGSFEYPKERSSDGMFGKTSRCDAAARRSSLKARSTRRDRQTNAAIPASQ